MVSAYILVKLAASADSQKSLHALQQPGVKAVDMILGPWDAIVRCEVDDFAGLGRLARGVRSCPGIADSLTCAIV
jgi:hypothetical protein